MKTYLVKIATYAVVLAENVDHANQVAASHKHDALRDDVNPLIEVECEVTRLEDLKHGWDGECIPYGGDGNTRLNAILSHRPAAVGEVHELFLCESSHLYLSPDRLYRFTVDPKCSLCAEAALAAQPGGSDNDR